MFLSSISNQLKGSIYIFLSALLYSTLPILGKIAYDAGLNPGSILILRFVFSFAILSLFITVIKRSHLFVFSPLVIVQGLFMGISGLLYFYALKYLSAGLTTVIFFSHPVLVASLAILIYKEKFSKSLFLGLALALTGVILVSGIGGAADVVSYRGIIFALLSCLCYAFYSLLGQKNVSGTDPLSLSATLFLVVVILVMAINCSHLDFITRLNLKQLMITLTMAVFNTSLAILFFLTGVKKIGASRASLISTAEPPLCIIMAFIILGETLTMVQLTGSILVFISMILAVSAHHQSPSLPVQNHGDIN